MLIESANPTMNGRASRGSSQLMNDESFSAAVARAAAALEHPQHGALAGSLSTAGSRRAAWNCGVETRPRRRTRSCRARVEEHRQEDRGAERAAHLPEERGRRGGDAHVLRRHGVLHGENQGLHVEAEPEAEHERVDVHRRDRGVGVMVCSSSMAASRTTRPMTREPDVAAGARDELARRDRAAHDADDQRQQQQAGRGRAEALDDLQVQRQRRPGRRTCPCRRRSSARADGEGAAAEQPQREQGVVAEPALGQQEQRRCRAGRSRSRRPTRPRSSPIRGPARRRSAAGRAPTTSATAPQ